MHGLGSQMGGQSIIVTGGGIKLFFDVRVPANGLDVSFVYITGSEGDPVQRNSFKGWFRC